MARQLQFNSEAAALSSARPLERREFYVILFLAEFINGVSSLIVSWTNGNRTTNNSLEANWIIWLGALASLRLLWLGGRSQLRSSDFCIGAICLILSVWPIPEASWLAVSFTGLGLAFLRPRDECFRGAGLVMLAMSVPMLWGKLIAYYLAVPLIRFDTIATALVTGVRATGNVLYFVHSNDNVMVAWACTSFASASFALLLFVALVRSVRPTPKCSEILTFSATFMAIFCINTARLALILQSRAMYVLVHGPAGSAVVAMLLPAAAMGFALIELRRNIV